MCKFRGYKIAVYILFVCISIGCLSNFFINIFERPKHDLNAAERVWNFSSDEVTVKGCPNDNGIYETDYDVFEISNVRGMLNFLSSLRNYGGATFKGKSVRLTSNIYDNNGDSNNYAIDSMLSFEGTFDGQGYEISKLTYNGGAAQNIRLGFLSKLASGGVIKNTIFSNFTFNIQTFESGATRAGCIVGENNGTIQNCVVNSVKFISNRYQSNCSVASIVGVNNGTVKNCMVRGTYTIGGNDENGLTNSDGLKAHYFAVTGNEAKDCIFAATMSKTGVTDKLITPDSHDTALTSNNGNFGSCASAYSNMSSSVASKTAGESGTPWYKYSVNTRGYSRSASLCVYLRYFIKWTTYKFTASPSGGGTINYSTLTVPTDYNNVTEVTNNQLLIDLNYVTPTPAEGNEFDKWTNSGNTYTANFLVRITLTFATALNTTIDSSSTAKTGTTYYLANPTTITFTHEDYTKSGCFKSYTISFTDKNGTAYFIKYKANANYYISGNTLSVRNDRYSMTSNKTGVKVNTAFKTYDLTLK